MVRTTLIAIAAVAAFLTGGARAQESGILPENIIFVTSTGYWEESGAPLGSPEPDGADASAQTPGQRGYYKLIAVRQPEGNAHIHLQQIASGTEGPKVVSSAELEEFSGMKAYVTDIRPESSDGVSPEPGLFATVYLKTDPEATEAESWTVLIDDIGDIKIERETN